MVSFNRINGTDFSTLDYSTLDQLRRLQVPEAGIFVPPIDDSFALQNGPSTQAGDLGMGGPADGPDGGGDLLQSDPADNDLLAANLLRSRIGPQPYQMRGMPFEMGGGGGVNGLDGITPEDLLSFVEAFISDVKMRNAARQALQTGRVDGMPQIDSPSYDQIQQANQTGVNWTPLPGSGLPTSLSDVPHFAQQNYGQQLGTGDKSIRQAGCLLTSLTMAYDKMTGKNLDPPAVNQILKQAGAFNGSGLDIGTACKALGLNMSNFISSVRNDPSSLQQLDGELGKGHPVILGVKEPGGWAGPNSPESDHWILITGKNADGTYRAVDSWDGKDITLDQHLNCTSRSYTANSLAMIN